MVKEWVGPDQPPSGDLSELEQLANEFDAQRQPRKPSRKNPSRTKPGAAARPSAPSWNRGDLALVFVGAACFVLSYFTFAHGSPLPNRVYPLWALFIGLGAIATTGGLLSIYVGPDPPGLGLEDLDPTQFVVVERERWAAMQSELRTLRKRSQGGGTLVARPPSERGAAPVPRRISQEEHRAVLGELEALSGQRTTAPAARPLTVTPAAALPAERSGGGMTAISRPIPAPVAVREPPPEEYLEESAGEAPTEEYVEIPEVGEVEGDALRAELDAQLKGVALGSAPTPPSGTPPTPPSTPRPPSTTAPPSTATSPAPPVEHPAPEEDRHWDEEPQTPDELAEIEDLARKFAAVSQPMGGFEGPRAPTAPAISAPAMTAGPTTLPARSPPSSRYPWESAAIRAALDYCVDRAEGETAEAFVGRVRNELKRWTAQPPPIPRESDRARAFVGAFVEAQRVLSAEEIARLDSEFRARVEALGKAIGLPIGSSEPLDAYTLRLRQVLAKAKEREAPPPPRPPPPSVGSAPPRSGEPDLGNLSDELERMVQDIESSTFLVNPPSPEGSARAKKDPKGQDPDTR
ncbi:MAG: hypothetical protein KGJ69_13600 [Thermoplasmata archaeon]|nr:hypothetical protein [Thermoplasmata archaeon]